MAEQTALKPRILIADDNSDLLEMLKAMVCRIDRYRCETAEDGSEAITKFAQAQSSGDPFHLLLLDAAMPFKTGFEVAQYVRRRSSVPIVIMSAHNEAITAGHASYVEADEVLWKPFEPEELERILRLASLPRRPGERVAARVIQAVRTARQ